MGRDGDGPKGKRGSIWFRERRDDLWKMENQSRKLEMPVFNGEDPDGWIFRAKRYFTMNLLSDWEKIEASAICFEGEPLAWYQWEDGCQVIRS